MSPSGGNDRYDKALGMNRRICRRDFLNSTLLASGSMLLESWTPKQLLARDDDWTGYGGVGDYADSNGNTFEVMRAGHQIRDHVFDSPPGDMIDTGELFDCVVVGGGISGLAAALSLKKQGVPRLKCLILENHPIFGGEAKRNEFIVEGKRLMAPQGSDHFQFPYPHSFIASFYDWIGLDGREFKYQTWSSSSPEIPLGVSFEDAKSPQGFYFGAKFGQRPGMWLIDPWVKNLRGAPIEDSMRAELVKYHAQREEERGRSGLPFDHPGDEKSRQLDSMTIEEHLMQEYGLSRKTIRTLMLDVGNGHGAGPDVLSAYVLYVARAESPEAERPGEMQSFPGGNTGIARQIVKTLIPQSISGPRTLSAVCRNPVEFRSLDRAGQATRIRLGATVVRVEHDGDPQQSGLVSVTYTRQGKVYRLKARSVVMAGGSWTTKHIVRDLPSAQREAYEQFYRSPCLMANVAVPNWRFLYKLGISSAQWFEGFGSFTAVRKVPTFSTDDKTIGPDSPVVVTLKALFHHPGLLLEEQGNLGRAELLTTSFREYERRIREQLTEMFSGSGFDAQRDIAGIILNRWGHAYASSQPGFFFGKDGKPAPRDILRGAPFGRIAFANTDLAGEASNFCAIKEAHRAVGQILPQARTD